MSSDGVVYIVDDEEGVRRSIARLVRSVGLRAETFPSAQAFLAQKLEAGPACLVRVVERLLREAVRVPVDRAGQRLTHLVVELAVQQSAHRQAGHRGDQHRAHHDDRHQDRDQATRQGRGQQPCRHDPVSSRA